MSDADEAFDRAWRSFKELDAQHAALLATAAEYRAKADALVDQRHAAMLDVIAALPGSSRIAPAKKRIILSGLVESETAEATIAKLRAIDLQDVSASLAAAKAELDAWGATLPPARA